TVRVVRRSPGSLRGRLRAGIGALVCAGALLAAPVRADQPPSPYIQELERLTDEAIRLKGNGDVAAAAKLAERALAITEAHWGQASSYAGVERSFVGVLWHEAGDDERARVELERAVKVLESAFSDGKEHSELAT